MTPLPVRLIRAILFFIPRANPDVEPLYPQVRTWALELSDEGTPQREIGLNEVGVPLFCLPNKRNTGFWTDMALRQFDHSEVEPMAQQEFDRLWKTGCDAHATVPNISLQADRER